MSNLRASLTRHLHEIYLDFHNIIFQHLFALVNCLIFRAVLKVKYFVVLIGCWRATLTLLQMLLLGHVSTLHDQHQLDTFM
jgi:hypothetical protein